MIAAAVVYAALLILMLLADAWYVGAGPGGAAGVVSLFADPDLRYATQLSLATCGVTAVLSVVFAVPVAYLLSRWRFPGVGVLDAVMDAPLVLPPLAVGVSLLILLQLGPDWLSSRVVYQAPAVILAQFVVASSLAVRTMRATFDQLDRRPEQVARTLGATRLQAFAWVVLPECYPGMLTAGTLAWARSLGEFGPVLVLAGATRGKTEVLSTTVYLQLSVGDLRGAVTVSLLMIVAATAVLLVARAWGARALKL